jgi:ATP-dependent DNA helicase RecQ
LSAANPPQFSNQDESRVRGLIEEGHESIRTPRQLTRFLCGITSPATTRAKLRRETRMFGAFDTMPFKQTLEWAERLLATSESSRI